VLPIRFVPVVFSDVNGADFGSMVVLGPARDAPSARTRAFRICVDPRFHAIIPFT